MGSTLGGVWTDDPEMETQAETENWTLNWLSQPDAPFMTFF